MCINLSNSSKQSIVAPLNGTVTIKGEFAAAFSFQTSSLNLLIEII